MNELQRRVARLETTTRIGSANVIVLFPGDPAPAPDCDALIIQVRFVDSRVADPTVH